VVIGPIRGAEQSPQHINAAHKNEYQPDREPVSVVCDWKKGSLMADVSPRVVQMRANALLRRFERVRALTIGLTRTLSDADASAQSMPDASPAKWHLAHTTWLFENRVLRELVGSYREFDARFSALFGGPAAGRVPRSRRGMLTRPSLETVLGYRAHVDAAIAAAILEASPEQQDLIELICSYEERHQERLVTDMLHLFAESPLAPAVWDTPEPRSARAAPAMRWVEGRYGAAMIGASEAGFSFGAERPCHRHWLKRHRLANRLVTNGEWILFMDAGGYLDPGLWLADGWAWVRTNSIEAPLYWRKDETGEWAGQLSLGGFVELNIGAPVRNVSYYEADAFARWSGGRLPTEAEWETAARDLNPTDGTFMDAPEAVEPQPAADSSDLTQMFGDLWEWTSSAFIAYPGHRRSSHEADGDEQFMSGRCVLKGGSCATPRGHVRASYRNFLQPHQRWQVSGVRLAMDD
jgi:ergothioneine biosynthesis protein EgtB